MAMGIVSDKEFESDLVNSKAIIIEPIKSDEPEVSGEIIDITRGRGQGNNQVPDGLRKIIGETSAIEGREAALDLARQFDISPSSVSAYKNGAHSTSSMDVAPNALHINQAKERISKRARQKLQLALSHITPDKLEAAKATDLAGVAKDMSVIIKNMEPDNLSDNNDKKQQPQFVLFAPTFVKEETFETLYVKE